MKTHSHTWIVLALFVTKNGNDLSAQTLTCQTSCPVAGEVFAMRTSSPVIPSGGQNKVWNYSGISFISPVTHNISYNPVGSVPNASLFPQANLVKQTYSGIGFLNTSISGIRGAFASNYTVNSDPMLLPLPFTYGDTYSETINSTTVTGTNTFVTSTAITFTAYGSGTLILPSGTFPDVLAIKYMSKTSKLTNGVSSGYYYYNTSHFCYAPYISHPILFNRQLFESGPVDYAPFTEFLDHAIVGISEGQKTGMDLEIFPNPATDHVIVNLPQFAVCTAQLINSYGQVLIKKDFSERSLEFDLHALPAGAYIVSVRGQNYSVNKKLMLTR